MLRYFVAVPLAILIFVLGFGPPRIFADRANAFGTINGAGQNAEHGRITRLALQCRLNSPLGSCFSDRTLASLAGDKGAFGAVGAPDRGRGMLTSNAHCSGGDFLDVAGYPQTRGDARAMLEACREFMVENFEHAVKDANDLLDQDAGIRGHEASMMFGCTYVGKTHGRAKCNILAHLGRVLHASQDFYAHSNWVDTPDLTKPISADNPPGLGQQGIAPWLDLRDAMPAFPEGLISGCFENISFVSEEQGCQYGNSGSHRVRHASLNKDRGQIAEEIGPGTTSRGAINDNFKHAVEAAIADSADKWLTYREALVAEYGHQRATLMACIITEDKPKKNCELK